MQRLFLIAALVLAGCGGGDAPATPSARTLRSASWQNNIREADRKRLAGLWSAWTRSLNESVGAGQGAAIAALGRVAVADAASTDAPPPPGSYRCRSIKLGRRADFAGNAAAPMLEVSDFGPCAISQRSGLLWFEQGAGVQRLAGTLYADGERRVFLGSLALAGEPGMLAYGSDATRDQLGVLRAIGPGHWRLELPWPNWQANLEIIEILPV